MTRLAIIKTTIKKEPMLRIFIAASARWLHNSINTPHMSMWGGDSTRRELCYCELKTSVLNRSVLETSEL